MKKGLSASQLKIIAILAMVCDHAAWGFVEMFSVQGQIMHVIGRLTIPIMCFFIAEGYRKTSNLKRYIYRMMIFASITIVPFYLFFGEEYGYRQNIIFDLLLALLTLSIIDHKTFSKPVKVILASILILTSAVIGGWPILPICFVLTFYYGKSFKQKAFIIAGTTVFLEVFMITTILLNNKYHFSSYDWVWYQWLYFLGFVLALPILYFYNGKRGNYPLGKYFFYLFYPGHFLILYSIKQIPAGNIFNVYLLIHIISLLCALALVTKLIFARPSRALTLSILLGMSGIMYIFGFVMEIYTGSLDIAYAGTVVEYFGECLVFLCFLAFMAEMCHKKIPALVYLVAALFSMMIIYMIMTTKENQFFYESISIDSSGPFPRLVLDHGIGFFIFEAYMIIACSYAIIMGLTSLPHFHGIEKKRIKLVLLAIFCPWFAFLLKLVGLTVGYEISALGVLGSISLIYRAIFSYGYFDSIQLAGENALHHFGDGVLVVDSTHKVLYQNKSMKELFPDIKDGEDVSNIPTICDLVNGTLSTFTIGEKTYDADITSLEEQGYVQGIMLTTKDMTEHYEHLRETERFAHTDSLTGLSNRSFFKTCFDEFRQAGGIGCMLMFDLDNFKGVNDTYGHGVGDIVLVTLAETILHASNNYHLSCRIGGDEFCMFLKDTVSKDEVCKMCDGMIKDFPMRLEEAGHAGITSISIGAAILAESNHVSEDDFKNIYKCADQALYVAKNSGKATYRLFSPEMAQNNK